MKKLTLAATFALLATPTVQADTIFGIYAGAGVWQSEYSGEAGDPSITLKDLGFKERDNNFYYIAIEHPIPVIPNIRLEHLDLSSKQTSTITRTFELDGTPYLIGDRVTSDFDLTHTDATLYYEILDNWVNLDIGVTARMFDGYVKATSTTSSEKVNVDQTLPLFYAKAQFDLPLTGLSAGVEGNFIKYKDDELSDYRVKVSYLFDSAFDIGVEVGYRQLSLAIDEDDVEADVELKGPYASAIVHF
ncbi:MAG: TIGR04219 family outer membrane beta-barrel protein [Moraxellaceae bacterium]|nr:MAG: TIGR04219 family outer membrane beta-barrel protein [Moraxellaceae bacterium]